MRSLVLLILILVLNAALVAIWFMSTADAPAPPPPTPQARVLPSTPDSLWSKADSALSALFVRMGIPPKSIKMKEGEPLPTIFGAKSKSYKLVLPGVYAPALFETELGKAVRRWGGEVRGQDLEYHGKEFRIQARQQPKRALVELTGLPQIDSARNPVVWSREVE